MEDFINTAFNELLNSLESTADQPLIGTNPFGLQGLEPSFYSSSPNETLVYGEGDPEPADSAVYGEGDPEPLDTAVNPNV